MSYQRFNSISRQVERGFTILEIVVALAIIGILAAVIYPNLRTDQSKATLLVTTMQEVGKNLIRMKVDTACYPSKLAALYDKAQADQSFCGIDLRPSWKQPYISKSDFDAGTGNLKIDAVATGVQLSIVTEPSAVGFAWIVRATGVTNEMIRNALVTCNGGATAQGKCAGTEGGAGNGTLDLVFDENT